MQTVFGAELKPGLANLQKLDFERRGETKVGMVLILWSHHFDASKNSSEER